MAMLVHNDSHTAYKNPGTNFSHFFYKTHTCTLIYTLVLNTSFTTASATEVEHSFTAGEQISVIFPAAPVPPPLITIFERQALPVKENSRIFQWKETFASQQN